MVKAAIISILIVFIFYVLLVNKILFIMAPGNANSPA
jgi:hypothetical protein